MIDTVIFYLASLIAVIFTFCPHEFAHAYVAYKNGDATAKLNGRLTLNPLKHIDPAGFIMCVFVGFGWAKPVPIDPSSFRHYKRGMFATAIAGVVVNYITAFIMYLLFVVVTCYMPMSNDVLYYIGYFLLYTFYLTFTYCLCSVVFNLLPLYPLDGFRVVEAFTREVSKVQRFLRYYGQAILIILIVESFICDILSNYVGWAQYADVLNYVMRFATDIIGYPIQKAWDWIYAL